MRRLTLVVAIVIIAVSLAVGVYVLEMANGPTSVDSKIGKPVSGSDISTLYRDSLQPYGPTPSAAMVLSVHSNGPAVLTVGNKPVVIYIGAEYCPYCAIQRWSLVMGLMRFGNFTGLSYMTSRPGDVGAGDYPTFTFAGSTYSSPYISFQPFEVDDRNGQTLTTVPANYSAPWTQAGSGFPFMNFANSYTVPGSMLANPQVLTGKNWTQVLTSITTSDSTGLQIRESANLITSIICKLTSGRPASVCTANPIASQTASLAGPKSGSMVAPPLQTPGQAKIMLPSNDNRRRIV